MGEIQNKYFTQEERAKIRNRSAFMLPNNPSQKGLTAEQIKRSLYEPILMMFDLMQKIEVDFPQGGGSGGSGGNVNVDLSNYYTKEETLALILTEIGNQYHFHAEIVESTEDVKEANVLYLIKIESSTLSDEYEEYLLIDDVATKIGDTSIDLSPYYTKTEVDTFVNELRDTFLSSLEALREEVNNKTSTFNVTLFNNTGELNKVKITQNNVTQEITITNVDHAKNSTHSTTANRDGEGNEIITTYATNTRVEQLITQLNEEKAKIVALQNADKNVYTKEETQSLINSVVSNLTGLKSQVVTNVSEITQTNVLYLIKANPMVDDAYEEWLLIDGTPTKIGDTTIDLTDILDRLTALESSKPETVDVTYTNATPTPSALGGIAKGTTFDNKSVKEMFDMLLYPYVAFSYSFSLTPDTKVREVGESVDVTIASITLTKGSADVNSITIKDGSTILGTKTTDIYQTGLNGVPISLNVTSDKTITAVVTDTTGKTITKSLKYKFVYPYYIGVIGGSAELTESVVTGLTKYVASKTQISWEFTMNQQKAVVSYPSSYGSFSKIVDENGFDVTDTFIKNTLTINGTEYYVYVLGNTATTSMHYQFNY